MSRLFYQGRLRAADPGVQKWSFDCPAWLASGWLPLAVLCFAAGVVVHSPPVVFAAAAGGKALDTVEGKTFL